MMRVNAPYILVQINKEDQNERRSTFYASQKPHIGFLLTDQDNPAACIVMGTESGSPAEAAGFNKGDCILALENLPVSSTAEFINTFNQFKPGQEITIKYLSVFNPSEPFEKKVTVGVLNFKLSTNATQLDMRYNLQHGTIIDIGKMAKEEFPEMELGDLLLFHHTVEYRPRTEGDLFYNDWHLIETLPNGDEIRLVRVYTEVFGVVKPTADGYTIIPYKEWIFCHPRMHPAEFQIKNGIWQPLNWKMTMDEMTDKLADLAQHFQSVGESTVMKQKTTEENYRIKEDIQKRMEEINRERMALAKKVNESQLMESRAIFINPVTNKELQQQIEPGDHIVMDQYSLYPLDLGEISYVLAKVSQIFYVTKHLKK